MTGRVSVAALHQMKRDARKIVAVVAWDCQIAGIADRAGADIVSAGDSVGVNLWGQPSPLEVTMEQMLLVCQAVRRGVREALVSVDIPFGPVQEGPASAVRAAVRLVKQAGADMVKIDDAASFPDAVAAVAAAGIPVWAQFGITPQTAPRYGLAQRAQAAALDTVPAGMAGEFAAQAERLQAAGAALLDFTNSGPAAGPEAVRATTIPVLGGAGGGPWLDGRIRMAHAAIGYPAAALDSEPDTYANVARITLDALTAYAGDVRSSRPIRGDRWPMAAGRPEPGPARPGPGRPA